MPLPLALADASLADFARRISALAGEDPDSRQEGLDLLAVAAGLKPLCLAGRGTAEPGWIHLWDGPILEGPIWEPQGDLPAWYLAATARQRARHPVLYLCRDRATRNAADALCRQGRAPVKAEADLLGYPVCCVAHHHTQALGLEAEIAKRASQLAGGDETRMVRLVETGAVSAASLPPIRPAPFTSVNMCDACANSRESPAALVSQSYRALAAAVQYEVL